MPIPPRFRRRYRPRLRPGGVAGGPASFEWEREEGEELVLYRVSGSVEDYDPGVCSGPVERCYPPEGGEAEIHEVIRIDEDGNETEVDWDKVFTSEELQEMEENLAENIEEPEPPEPDEDDYRYRRRRY